MSRFARGISIVWVVLRYGLDELVLSTFRQPWLRRWAASHHIHHHHEDANFGVTTPLWDHLLGTRYQGRKRPPAARDRADN